MCSRQSPAADFASRLLDAVENLKPFRYDSVMRYLAACETRPKYLGPIDGRAAVLDDGRVMIDGAITREQAPQLIDWLRRTFALGVALGILTGCTVWHCTPAVIGGPALICTDRPCSEGKR